MKKRIKCILILAMSLILASCGISEAANDCVEKINNIGEISLNSENSIIAAEQAYENLTAEEKKQIDKYYEMLSEYRNDYDCLVKANNVAELINSIGEVTINSENEINNAENAYNELTDEEKSKIVESSEKLTNIRNRYNKIYNENKVVKLIKDIGTVTTNSEKAIIAAEEAYDKLSDDEKEDLKPNYGELTNKRKEYENAVAAQKKQVENLIADIDSIGIVTLDSKESIESARAKYDKLNSNGRAMVTNYQKLVDAEKAYKPLYEAEKEKIKKQYLSKVDIKFDKMTDVTWYHHKNRPQYIDIRSYISPYIGERNNDIWLCVRYNYTGDDWVFWTDLIIYVDGKKYYKSAKSYDIVRDNAGGDVWEHWEDVGINASGITMLKEIANSKETVIRFQGRDYHYDLTVTQADKTMITDILELYDLLKS